MLLDLHFTIAGALTGFLVGLTGVGGGALMTPLLLIFFGVAPITAVATDLWFAVVTKAVAAKIHHEHGQVDWQIVRRLWTGSLPVALIAVILVNFGNGLGKVAWLSQAIGIVVFVTAIGLLAAPKLSAFAKNRRISQPQKFRSAQPALTIIAGAVLGVSVALTSIGAGALGSVVLLYLYPLRMTPHRLVATDIVHAIPLALVAGLGYLIAGQVDPKMLASLLAGSIPAVMLGSFVSQKIPGRHLQMGLGVVLLVSGSKVLV